MKKLIGKRWREEVEGRGGGKRWREEVEGRGGGDQSWLIT
jgi:hypothetical protein